MGDKAAQEVSIPRPLKAKVTSLGSRALGMGESKARLSSKENLSKIASNDNGDHGIVNNAVLYENTFRMKPDRKFQSGPSKKIAEDVLAKTLVKEKYDAEKVPELCKVICAEILTKVKALGYERYKFVVEVTIGEFKGQGVRVASRAIWDTTTDSYASASFKNPTLFAVAVVFGCFAE